MAVRAHRIKTQDSWAIDCPGCKDVHVLDARWTFSGTATRPTFEPSLKVSHSFKKDIPGAVCHSWVRDGKIQFLPDSTHKLAGQTVDLPAWNHPKWKD